MKKIDLNKLADLIAVQEGKKKPVLNAAQARETLGLILDALATHWMCDNAAGVVELISKRMKPAVFQRKQLRRPWGHAKKRK